MRKTKKIPWAELRDDVNGSTESPWNDIQKHPRYISDWDENIVLIDVAHKSARVTEYREYNLSEIIIPRLGHVSPDGSVHYRLIDFPQLIPPLKAALNATLFRRSSGVAVHISYFIIHSIRVFGWMLNKGRYNLAQLSKHDTNELRNEYKTGGWSRVLKLEKSLSAILKLVGDNPQIGKSLIGHSHDRNLTIKASLLSLMVGMPCSGNDVPRWFARKLARLVNSPKPARKRTPIASIGKTAFARFMGDMNRFTEFPTTLGAMTFVPFPEASKDASAAFSKLGGRTANIGIDDAVKIFAEALRWMRDYSQIILEVAACARLSLEREVGKSHTVHLAVRAAVRAAYQDAIRRHGIALPGFPTLELADLNKCISTLQVACFCICASNHGRRRNELVGRTVPYGLYFGCIKIISNIYDDVRIDVYVEKSFQNYVSFWCNSLVREAVQCLEDLSQLFRPLHSPLKEYHPIREDGRDDKLFQRRSFTAVGFSEAAEAFDFGAKCTLFFELAQVDVGYMNERTHPFRRIFGLLFKYRYDRFRLAALGQQYGHELSCVTEVYLTDAPGTSPANGVEALFAEGFGRELLGFKKMMGEVSDDYLGDILLRLLKGELIGGIFARMALKLMQRLSSNVQYWSKSDEEKAEQLREQLKTRGYTTSEKEHGICCATMFARTKGRSNCFADGMIHPENASPEMCGSCLHLLTTPGYREGLVQELAELRSFANDFSLSTAARMRYEKEAQALEAYIEADVRVAASNQIALRGIEARWVKIFVDGGN